MDEREKLIQGIRALVDESGMKQKAIAKKCGFSEQEFSNMLNGRKVIMGEHIPAIARALGVTPNDIFNGKTA
ncbi:MAG: helix-turn-helix transcriptional regulator [Clostridia bacterium]|nr:helix-turn-helix transcriptional regulator [Clostridia bacterium]